MESILEALNYISSDEYDTWYRVGMALKYEGFNVDIWDSWSRSSSKYKPGECERKWNSFHNDNGELVTGATIIDMAKKNGFETNRALDWDDYFDELPSDQVGRDFKIIDHEFVKSRTVPDAGAEPVSYLRHYLNVLFKPDEYVGYCDRLDCFDGKYVPKHGIFRRTASEILKDLEKGIEYAGIQEESEGGAMIRFNPLDGDGESDANVTDFRYCLFESDKESIEKQYALYLELKLPIVFLVHSGNKSLHAIIHVDAGKDHTLYRSRVNFIYDFCRKNGLTPDENDKNPSRYSRMPGIKRSGNLQYIVAENVGFSNYLEWEDWAKAQNDNLPKDCSLKEIMANLKPLKEELIEGILRVNHKMLISAPSKAGKSFLLMYLAVCFAEGMKWLGHKCKQGRVFYINLELDEDSCNHRFADIYKGLGIDNPHMENIQVWHLRGMTEPLDKLAPFIVRRTENKGYLAIIIDPIYKVITGDENNATEMSEFCSYFDKIALKSSVALVYSHHHSKGAGMKYSRAADRASGSGVFARDPDAILDLIELEATEDMVSRYREQVPGEGNVSAWEISGTLREFPPMGSTRLWFDYPCHVLDEWNFLAEAKEGETARRKVGMGKKQTGKESRQSEIESAFCLLGYDLEEGAPLDEISQCLGRSSGTIRNWLKEKFL